MNDAEKNKLWQEYKKSGSSQIREQLIMEYAQLVKIVAGRLNMNLGSGLVESGVNKLDGLMLFENEYDEEVSCMIAIDFSRYLLKKGIRIQDVTSFEIQFGVYDAL